MRIVGKKRVHIVVLRWWYYLSVFDDALILSYWLEDFLIKLLIALSNLTNSNDPLLSPLLLPKPIMLIIILPTLPFILRVYPWNLLRYPHLPYVFTGPRRKPRLLINWLFALRLCVILWHANVLIMTVQIVIFQTFFVGQRFASIRG